MDRVHTFRQSLGFVCTCVKKQDVTPIWQGNKVMFMIHINLHNSDDLGLKAISHPDRDPPFSKIAVLLRVFNTQHASRTPFSCGCSPSRRCSLLGGCVRLGNWHWSFRPPRHLTVGKRFGQRFSFLRRIMTYNVVPSVEVNKDTLDLELPG